MHPLRQNPARLAAVASGLTVSTAAVIAAALVVGAAPVGAASSTTTTTPAAATTPTTAAASSGATAQYNAALKAIGTKGVHFASVAKQNGAELDVSGDAGTTSGAQTLVVKQKNITERMSAKVVGSTGYVSGNAAALQHVIGLTTADSSKYAGKWLSFPTSNQGLGELVGGLLSSQVSKELEIGGPYTYGKTATVAGQPATAIKGAVATQNGGKVPVVLYVPAKGTPLPIQEVTNAGTGGGASAIHGIVTFTHWGENKSQTAPAKSTSLLKLVPASSGSTTAG
jgi:hypothetical protein